MTNPTRAEIEKLIDDRITSNDNIITKEQRVITHLLTSIDVLREALGFYKQLLNYMAELQGGKFDFKHTLVHIDGGDKARKALAQTEHLKKEDL